MFDSVLVANRGEIACRVLRTAQALGYRGIAVYSEADRGAPHVQMADVAVCIGPAAVSESYLCIERILEAARRTGAGAVHPGYGFLSENAGFAEACAQAGLVFVGPPAAAIAAMGDKARAKVAMRAAGVPCVPGFDGVAADDQALIGAAADVGYPLLVKASAGGGGRGMRRVDASSGLAEAIASARAEATAAFGDPTLLLERLVQHARHVEVQVFADAHGGCVSLGERDCSVQRRHQKVVEEAPCPAVDAALRQAMGVAAVRAAQAVGYVGAGTVEFLLDGDGAFYFLEMNTRLQVEHPVTEAVTGLDLVELQLRVAAGERLPDGLGENFPQGHAIEARIYAESTESGYVPQVGTMHAWDVPDGVRVDAGVVPGQAVSSHYDPMLAKLVAWGPDRDTARRRLARALERTVALGVTTNRQFLRRILWDHDFVCGEVDTQFLDSHALTMEAPLTSAAVAVAARVVHDRGGSGFRIGHPQSQPLALDIDGQRQVARVCGTTVQVGADDFDVSVTGSGLRRRVTVDGVTSDLVVHIEGPAVWMMWGDHELRVDLWRVAGGSQADVADGAVVSPMAGRVLAVGASVGKDVNAGDVIVLVEAMKIETTLRAGVSGTVTSLAVDVGDVVEKGQVLAVIQEVV